MINNTFRQKNYYLTSLGNSIEFDADTVRQLNDLLHTKDITDITFVLSDDNRIVSDALKKQEFSEITGLSNFYHQIARQKEYSEGVWQTRNRQFLMLSYHLNSKIKELKRELKCASISPLKINGKIYNRQEKVFNDIYSDLICRDYISVN